MFVPSAPTRDRRRLRLKSRHRESMITKSSKTPRMLPSMAPRTAVETPCVCTAPGTVETDDVGDPDVDTEVGTV